MTVVNGYATVAEIRDQLGDTGSKLDLDLLEKSINTASRAIDLYCSGGRPGWRKFWLDAQVTTRFYQTDDPALAWTDDIGSTVGLVVKTDDTDSGTYGTTLTLGTHFQLEPLNANVVAAGDTATPWAFWKIARLGTSEGFSWYQHRPALSVTAKFGWSSVPAEVNMSAIILAIKLFKRKDAPFGVAGMTDFGAVRIVQSDPDVKMLLQPYVKYQPRGLLFNPQRNSMFHQRWS